ncbi:MAG: class I SAM-dependent methyltransferase [Bacteriovoracaceae bacterium]|nr:class I SAM-dependent methyltransferase [Bacteriovoracaceae bacterium]
MDQKDLLSIPLYTYSLSRSFLYSFEFKLLQKIFGEAPAGEQPTQEDFEKLQGQVIELFKQDSRNIVDGIYPMQVLLPESPFNHIMRLPTLITDALRSQKQKKRRESKKFEKDNKYLEDKLPEYFKRNFHFQNQGYLSEESAVLYDHQVEMLFSGTANAMRRLLIQSLKKNGGYTSSSRIRILELACGTGSSSRFLRMAFPNAHITMTDLSRPYLKTARERLKQDDNLDFLQADAAELPFKDESFDIVCSVFLFHEIPQDIRDKVIQESKRVLKIGGSMGHLDSIQLHDRPEFAVFLNNFPIEYHEPFFKNYIQHPLEEHITKAGLQNIKTELALLSKCVFSTK